MSRKEYIGDSVYVEDQGFQICLFTDNGLGPSNEIFMEDSVIMDLFRFLERKWGKKIIISVEEDEEDV